MYKTVGPGDKAFWLSGYFYSTHFSSIRNKLSHCTVVTAQDGLLCQLHQLRRNSASVAN